MMLWHADVGVQRGQEEEEKSRKEAAKKAQLALLSDIPPLVLACLCLLRVSTMFCVLFCATLNVFFRGGACLNCVSTI